MTRFCTCPGSLASSLEYSKKRNKLAGASCKNCGGRFVVDGIGPLSRNMHGTLGLEVATSINPDFNWKTVTKGKRSRKAVARCMNRGAELGNKSPKRVGDFSGSDSDKFGETANGQCFSDKVEYVPLKKRRHFFRSPSPSSRPQLYGRDLVSLQLPTSSSHSEDFEHLSDHNGSSGSYTNRLLGRVGNGVDGAVSDKVSGLTSGVLYNSDNFSGIALLAAAACINNIDEDTYNDKVDAMEVSSAPQRSDDASTSSLPQREIDHYSESGKQVDTHLSGLKGCSFGVDNSVDASHNSSGSEELTGAKSVSLKVDRLHWDLNTSMDAWEQPNKDEDNDKDNNYLYAPNVVMQIMKLDKEGCVNERVSRNTGNDAEGCLPVGQIENAVECSISKLEGNDSEELCSSHDRAGIKETSCSTLNGNSGQRLDFCSADTKFSGHILNSSESIDNSPKAESCHSSEVSGQYLDTRSACVAVTQGGGGSRNVIAMQSAGPSDYNITLPDDSDLEKYGCEIDAQKEVAQESQKITELPGNLTSLGQEMCIGSCKTLDAENSESISGNDSHPSSKYASVTTSDISVGGECGGSSDAKGQHLKLLATNVLGRDAGENQGSKATLSEYEDPQSSNGEADAEGMCILEDLGKDFVPEDHQNLDVSEEDLGRRDARENIAELDIGYDSPYEDGELRGSVLYSWDGNEFEDGEEHECLDYESDGRGGEDSDAGEFSDQKIMEADSEGIDKRSLLAIPVQETDSMKSGSARIELENANAEKTDPTGEKTSNQGSGTTEEVTADSITERNHGSVRRRHTSNHMDVLDVEGSCVGEVGSKTIRGKLQSRIEGPSPLDTTERDVAYSRSRDGGTFLRAVRDGSPDRFGTGYRSAAHHRDRSGGLNQCVYWDSRNRGPSGYRGPDGHGPPRQRTGIANSVDKFGAVDSRDQKHPLNYSSRADRDGSPDNFQSRYRSAVQERGRNGKNSQLTYWDPRMRYSSSYRGQEDHGQTRPRSAVFDSVDKFGGFSSYDRKQPINYSSKSMQRPLGWRRSPIDRDEYHGGPRRMAGFSSSSSGNRGGSRKFSEGVDNRGFREEYHQPVNDDDASSVRMPHLLSWRERNIFPHSTRGAHVSVQRRSSRSRSRTRSPRAWQPQRERDLGTRRHSRSPDFRSESRMDRMRAPFQKPSFGADYGDSFMSPHRGRFSPQRNFRRADDRNVVDIHLRHRRSPFIFRQNQRLDSVGFSGRLKSDDSFRPIMRPGRFPPMAGAGRGCKLEDSNEDKGHD